MGPATRVVGQRPNTSCAGAALGDTHARGGRGTSVLVLIYATKTGTAASWCDALLDQACGATPPLGGGAWAPVRADIALRQGGSGRRLDATRGPALGLLPPRNWGVLIGYSLSVAAAGLRLTGQRGIGGRANSSRSCRRRRSRRSSACGTSMPGATTTSRPTGCWLPSATFSGVAG